MTNNREKGKRGERWAANAIKHIFPKVRRNAGEQAQSGGVDLENTDPFNIEVKIGKAYKSKMIRSLIDQVEAEGKDSCMDVVLVKPDREKAYVLMPFEDWLEVLGMMKTEQII